MRIRHTASEEEAINLMPLIDMVFLLLIFFLAATTFAQQEERRKWKERETAVQLPGTSAAQPLSAPPKQFIVNILADGTTKVDTEVVTRGELAKMLETLSRNEPDRQVLIRADERSLHRYFAGVADLCRKVGIHELKIGYLVRPKED